LNLPVLLNLIKVAKLRVPDETDSKSASLFTFARQGGWLARPDRQRRQPRRRGEMNADGTDVQFEFYPVWSKMKEMFALPGEWSGMISKSSPRFA
jgi:hypothetical protein